MANGALNLKNVFFFPVACILAGAFHRVLILTLFRIVLQRNRNSFEETVIHGITLFFMDSISKTVTGDVPSDPIGGRKYAQFLRRGNFARTWGLPSHHPSRDIPCPFSPTHGFLHLTFGSLNNVWSLFAITVLEMHPFGQQL